MILERDLDKSEESQDYSQSQLQLIQLNNQPLSDFINRHDSAPTEGTQVYTIASIFLEQD